VGICVGELRLPPETPRSSDNSPFDVGDGDDALINSPVPSLDLTGEGVPENVAVLSPRNRREKGCEREPQLWPCLCGGTEGQTG
jgi:hypothetical protein